MNTHKILMQVKLTPGTNQPEKRARSAKRFSVNSKLAQISGLQITLQLAKMSYVFIIYINSANLGFTASDLYSNQLQPCNLALLLPSKLAI
jgi:hypothetical protein